MSNLHAHVLTEEQFVTFMEKMVQREKFLVRYYGSDKLLFKVLEKVKDHVDIIRIKEEVAKVDPYLFSKLCFMTPKDENKFVVVYGKETDADIPFPIRNRMIHVCVEN